jgi:histone H1/5
LADKYKLDMSSAANLNHVNKAIARGVEVGVFDQPKGSGGKVKLVKKVRPASMSRDSHPLRMLTTCV